MKIRCEVVILMRGEMVEWFYDGVVWRGILIYIYIYITVFACWWSWRCLVGFDLGYADEVNGCYE